MKWHDIVLAVRVVAAVTAAVATALAGLFGDAGFLVPAAVAAVALPGWSSKL